MMKGNLKYLAILFIYLVLGFSLQAQEKPNVLMLCVDDMNDWVGFLGGHPQTITPNMDRLAEKGVNFTNAHCTAPGCSPSRNALLFGVEPHNSGLYPFYNINNIEDGVLNDYTPLPLLFRNNGYTTCGLTKVFHNPDNAYLQDSIWSEYKSYGDNNIQFLKDEGYYPEPYNKRMVACPASNELEDFLDYKNARHAVGFLEKSHENPFFLAVGFIRPHTPWIAPKANYDKFKEPIVAPEIMVDDLEDIPMAGRANAQLYMDYPIRREKQWEQMRRGYLACINFIDDNVGRVLEALDNSPYADNTIVVLWSDHGFHLGEKRSFSKFSLWNEATRTPFIIYDPRGQDGNGSRCGEPVGLINVYRTLCEMAGLTPPEYVDGMSLTPWLANPQKQKEKPAMTTWGRGNYTFRTKEWRYTRYFDGTEELYAEQCDPNEWNNLADNPEYKELKESFQKWLPQAEAPQVESGRELYNVADADDPQRNINNYNGYVEKYKNDIVVSPEAPGGLEAEETSDSIIVLKWKAVDGDITGYKVFLDGCSLESTHETSLEVDGLSPGTNYQFRVRSISSEGHMSGESEVLTVKTKAITSSKDKKATGESKIILYPVPAKNLLYLQNAPIGRVDIYQIDGEKVMSEKYMPGNPIDISSLQDSIYVLRLPEYGGESFTFIKN
jgi:arylsulfatase A-like enzyme